MHYRCRRTPASVIFVFLLQMEWIKSQDSLDDRCYLENDAVRESFTIPEDLPIGSTIGQLRVRGDPRSDIALHVEEPESPVIILPGSKNLTLQHKVDKEGTEGPSSVFINVICERLHTLQAGFVIPVTIRVTDTNDNSPVFVNAPYTLNISEVTVIGTRVLRGVHATDADQQATFSTVRYFVLPGPYSDFFEFENHLEGTLVLKKPLDYEKLRTFDVKIRAQDLGEPPRYTDTVLTVNVIDADDQNPKFYHEKYSAVVPEPPVKGTALSVKPEPIRAYDQDLGINATILYTFVGGEGDYKLFSIDKRTARVTLMDDLKDHAGKHSFTLVVRATQNDNPDRYALATLTVSRLFENAVRFLRRTFYITVPESNPPCVVIGVLATNKVGEDLKYYVSNKDVLKTFSISPRGELALRKSLDYEKTPQYFFRVFATDGITNDSASVNVTVKDVNEWEPRFRYPFYEFFIPDRFTDTVGKIEAKDGDHNDSLSLSLKGNNASLFYITPGGELRVRYPFNEISGTVNLEVVASDGAEPPHRTTVPVTVHFQPKQPPGVAGEKSQVSGAILLTGLGTLLLFLAVVVFVLVGYIVKSKRRSNQEGLLPSLGSQSHNRIKPESTLGSGYEVGSKLSDKDSGSVVVVERRKPSPKIHPAPPPPVWNRTSNNNNRRLNWNDKTEDDSNPDPNLRAPKLSDNMNLTVYF